MGKIRRKPKGVYSTSTPNATTKGYRELANAMADMSKDWRMVQLEKVRVAGRASLVAEGREVPPIPDYAPRLRFGNKYKGWRFSEVPTSYLLWMLEHCQSKGPALRVLIFKELQSRKERKVVP